MRRGLTPFSLTLCVLALSACGNQPSSLLGTHALNPLTPAPLTGLAPLSFPAEGLDIELPKNWNATTGTAPLVVDAASGTAAIAVWRYVRGRGLPRTHAELDAARAALEADARTRDPGFLLRSADLITAAGFPAIELLAREQVDGQLRAVRSTHVYAHGSEYVIDELAPVGQFEHLDREVFLPVIATLHLRRPPRAR